MAGRMADVSVRELRNDISSVLRRVEAGERLRVSVSGRPVAELIPLPGRARTMPWGDFWHQLLESRADAALSGELKELLPDTTDDGKSTSA